MITQQIDFATALSKEIVNSQSHGSQRELSWRQERKTRGGRGGGIPDGGASPNRPLTLANGRLEKIHRTSIPRSRLKWGLVARGGSIAGRAGPSGSGTSRGLSYANALRNGRIEKKKRSIIFPKRFSSTPTPWRSTINLM